MIQNSNKALHKQVYLRAILGPVLIISVVFIPAWKLLYWQGILYASLSLFMLLITFMSMRKNTDLINERLKPGDGIKHWDKIYFILTTPLYFFTLILGSLDTGRFKLSPELPLYSYSISVGIYIIGQIIFVWARTSNNYFSSVVRIQKDRGHKVCESGPYKYIRHPGYLGGLLFTAATPLILGSLWALIPTGISIILMIIRTNLEDKTLEEELEGYRDYKRKVRYKILPFVW